MQPHRGECLDLGIRRYAFLIAITLELTSYDLRGNERSHRAEDAQLLVAHRIGTASNRRIHCEQRYHLQHVVLHDVAYRPDFFIETSAALDAKVLGHGDLHARDVVP